MIALSSDSIDYGSLSRGDSDTKRVTIYNLDATSVDITDIVSSSPDYDPAPTLFTIDPYSSLEISIKYTASIAATATGTVTISNSAGPDEVIDVTAVVLEPTVNLITAPLVFGDVAVNDTKTMTREIANDATNGSVLKAIISSTDSNFVVSNTSLEIASGESADIVISFKPTSAGAKAGVIDVVVNDATGTYNFDVEGDSLTPTYTVIPALLDFMSIPINDMKTLPFEITNTHATVNLIVSAVTFPDSQFSVDITGVKISPTETQEFVVAFEPDSPASIINQLQVSTNAGDIFIDYEGTGLVVPLMRLSPTELNYDKYSLNDDQIIALNVSSAGVVDLEITSLTFPTVADTVFSTTAIFPLVIPHGENEDIEITVNSTGEVDFNDSITIISDAFDNPHTIDVSGIAQSPDISINVNELDFGTIPIDQTRQLSFIISNSKDVDLNVVITEAPHFTVQSTNITVPGNGQLSVAVTFLLEAPGEVQETLVVSSNDVAAPVINLVMKGVANLDHFFRVIPEEVIQNYIDKDIPEESELTVINRSLYNAAIDSMDVIPLPGIIVPHEITTTGLPIVLEPGGVAVLILSTLATDVGEVADVITLNTRVGETLQFNTTITIDFTGEVFSPTIDVSKSSISYGNVAIGSTDYDSVTIYNDSTGADLVVTITSDNPDVFHFKGTAQKNLVVSSSGGKYVADTQQADLVRQSVEIVDDLTGDVLVLGDPSTDPNEFSVNSDTGIITFNPATNNKSYSISYEYKLPTITLTIGKKLSTTFEIGFSPEVAGPISGTISLDSNDKANPIKTIAVDGDGLTAVTLLEIQNDIVKYEEKVGKPIGQRFVLKNVGNVRLRVNNIDIAEPFSTEVDAFWIDPNEEYELTVEFTGIDDVEVNQNITIESNAPDLIVPVVGQGQYPEMLLPANVDFGDVGLNITSEKILTITNSGDADLNVTLALEANDPTASPSMFVISPSVTTVLAHDTYDIKIKFTPTEEISYSETVEILSDDPLNLEVDLPLLGNGVKKPIIEVAEKLVFDKTNVRETSQKQLTVANVGTDPLQLTDLAITENLREFEVTFTPTTIAAGSSKQYTVSFNPKNQSKSTKGKITVTSNDTSNPSVEVLLKGKAVQPEGEWQSFNLQDMVPDPIITLANGVSSVIGPLKTILGLIKSILNLAKVLLIDTSNALKPLLEALQRAISEYIDNLGATGLYLLPIYPSSRYQDPNMTAKTAFGKYLASVGGGSAQFKKRIIDSFDDIYDSKRPQFTDSAAVGAVVLAVDSGNIVDVIKGIMSLRNIFSSIKWDPEIEAPKDVGAAGSDKSVTLRWALPEAVVFNIGAIANSAKMLDFVDSFDIYRSEQQGLMTIATQDYYDENKQKISSTGEVIDAVTKKTIAKHKTVEAKEFNWSVKNFAVGWKDSGEHVVNDMGFEFVDKGLTNGKNYYYAIRTKMGKGPDDPASQLSTEVVGSPTPEIETELSADEQLLDRCSYFSCVKAKTLHREIITLRSPIVRLVESMGITQQSGSKTTADKINPNANKQQVNTFSFSLTDANIDFSTVTIRNTSVAKRRLEADDATKSMDISQFISGNLVDVWDSDPSSESKPKKDKDIYFGVLDQTKLILGWDLTMGHGNNNTEFVISDVSNIGYVADDTIVVEYYEITYGPSCANETYSDKFNAKLCAQLRKDCDGYSVKRCQYHGGTACLNAGFTQVSEGRCVPNALLFNAEYCQSGAQGGDIRRIDKPFRNDPAYCIATTGSCAGYTGQDEEVTGLFPNWYNLSLQGLIKPIEQFLGDLEGWVNSQLAAIQKGAETTQQFIDLLGKKIEALEEFIDTLQQIVDIFLSIFGSDAGFHILMIEPEDGGIQRIKSIVQSAEQGPDSGPDGYTAGVVLLAGGNELDILWNFLKVLFD